MFGRARILLAIVTCALATPVAAQTPPPTTTAFDGTYVGVSRTLESTMGGGRTRYCEAVQGVAPLTIVNGVARTKWAGTAQGSVNAQGALVMRAPNGAQFEGQIDAQGTVKGRFTSGCSYQMVWQKRGK
jgi:hypothetical protein